MVLDDGLNGCVLPSLALSRLDSLAVELNGDGVKGLA